MMFNRIGIIFLMVVLAGTLNAQNEANNPEQNKIYGVWLNNQFGYEMTIVFNQDGSGEIDGESFTYSIQDNKLSVKTEQETTIYTYSQQGNSLTLSGGDLSQGVVFTKYTNEPGVTESNITFNQSDVPHDKGSPENPSDLIGIWSGNGETIEFRSDGQCVYLGHSYPYKISEGRILLTSSEGDAMIQYSIKGDQLSLTFNDKTVTYSKGNLNETEESQQNQAPGNGRIATELVGKWCFVDVSSYNEGASSTTECVMLNEDGTYEYFTESSRSVNTPDLFGGTSSQISDRGTWSYKDGLLYYNSQTRGEGSLILEKKNHPKNVNDPMIVLNGRAFVTQSVKPPW